MAFHNIYQIYDHVRRYSDECKWMFSLGQCSSLSDIYILLVHPSM